MDGHRDRPRGLGRGVPPNWVGPSHRLGGRDGRGCRPFCLGRAKWSASILKALMRPMRSNERARGSCAGRRTRRTRRTERRVLEPDPAWEPAGRGLDGPIAEVWFGPALRRHRFYLARLSNGTECLVKRFPSIQPSLSAEFWVLVIGPVGGGLVGQSSLRRRQSGEPPLHAEPASGRRRQRPCQGQCPPRRRWSPVTYPGLQAACSGALALRNASPSATPSPELTMRIYQAVYAGGYGGSGLVPGDGVPPGRTDPLFVEEMLELVPDRIIDKGWLLARVGPHHAELRADGIRAVVAGTESWALGDRPPRGRLRLGLRCAGDGATG